MKTIELQEILSIKDKLNSKKQSLSFVENTHKYYFNKKPLNNVTTFLNQIKGDGKTDSFNALETAKKCVSKRNYQFRGVNYYGAYPEKLVQLWNDYAVERQLLGTAFHNYIEHDLRQIITPSLENDSEKNKWLNAKEFPNELFYGYDNFKKNTIQQGFNNLELEKYLNNISDSKMGIIDLECRVVSEKYKLAGTFDALFVLKYQGKFMLLIFDWKTNAKKKEPFDYSDWNFDLPKNTFVNGFNSLQKDKLTEYTLQVFVYKWILENEYNIPVFDCRVVWFNNEIDFGYKIYKPKFKYNADEIESLLEWNLVWNNL